MTAILEQQPPPLGEIAKPIPQELDRIISRCLEKNAALRSQSARDVRFALTDLLSGPAREAQRAQFRFRRGPALSIAALLAAVLLLAAGLRVTRGNRSPESIAVLPFVNASGNPDLEYLGDGMTESLINTLSQVPNLAVMSRNSVFRYKGRETDAQAAGRSLKVQAVLTGTVAQRGDDLSISARID
ncbi:MAG TPA: hypothetical protein VKT49_22385 [Bryobacteraceae bacterium]|nr:hypothetical protein [Bryobacteraceae bacterium]